MDRPTFVNTMKRRRLIDRLTLEREAGPLPDATWRAFRGDPIKWMLEADDDMADAVWRLIRP